MNEVKWRPIIKDFKIRVSGLTDVAGHEIAKY